MLNCHWAIYKTIDDEIQLCLNYDRAIYKTIDDEIQLCLIMIELYINNWGRNTTLFNDDRAIYKTIDENTTLLKCNYDRAIYKTIDDEIQLCLIMSELYIKQLMMIKLWNTTLLI